MLAVCASARTHYRVSRIPRAASAFLLACLVVVLVPQARGAATVLTNPGEFSGAETVIDFESFSTGTLLTEQLAGLGVHFILTDGGAARVVQSSSPRQFGPPGPNMINNDPNISPPPYADLEVTFDTPMNRIAFEMRSLDADDLKLTVHCFANGQPVGQELFDTTTSFQFFGIQTTVPFDRIIFDLTDVALGKFDLDNLRFEFFDFPQAPVCDAGGPYTVDCTGGTTSVQLDSSGSFDPNLGETLTYFWQTDCPGGVFLPDNTSPNPILTIDSPGPCPLVDCIADLSVDDGNSGPVSCNGFVTVTDVGGPDVLCPDDVSGLLCPAEIPPPDVSDVSASDACSGPVTVTHEGDTDNGGPCGFPLVVSRTYRATDSCGNFSDCVQTITVDAAQLPGLVCPADTSVQLPGSIASTETGQAVASGGCPGSVTVSFTDVESAPQQFCPTVTTITRTWQADDACGVSEACDQFITVTGEPTPAGSCCDPDTGEVTPGVEEILCDGIDNDCDGDLSDDDADADGDGVTFCGGDCDDNDPDNYPGNVEVCDGQDNDCDGMDNCGACCDIFAACTVTLPGDCTGDHTFQGEGVACAPDLCPLVVPATSEWGLLTMVLLGLIAGATGFRQRSMRRA